LAEALKNIYSPAFVSRLAEDIARVSSINSEDFFKLVFDRDWEQRELKQRSKHIAVCMEASVKGTFSEQIDTLLSFAATYSGYTAIIFSDFVEHFGQAHWDESMQAMEKCTQLCTAEFAVRPYFMKDFERMVEQHEVWSKHDNEHIRRLASEGIRPRLPWGAGVLRLKQEPEHIFPILKNLLQDDSEYVRRSVANNLNDISKDYPELVLAFVRKLDLSHKNTQRLVKHALRGLLKKAHPEALALFGFHDAIELKNVILSTKQQSIRIGDTLEWHFSLEAIGTGNLRLEYHVAYQKANGKTSTKVFQLSEQSIDGSKRISMDKKLSFQDLSTRKHYPGKHVISLVANGRVKVSAFAEIASADVEG